MSIKYNSTHINQTIKLFDLMFTHRKEANDVATKWAGMVVVKSS